MEKKPQIYSSFEEIELDLQILKLEREIHAQKIKLNLEKTGENLRPVNLINDYLGTTDRTNLSVIEQVFKIILQFLVKPIKE
ncbi:DUF6327 family protein [Fluviicola sp.]|uniref:DUF6327 family protein n=1 Tax=Fluviicola sp. TaxID=1917219 RepID=UPI0031E1483F